MAIKALQTVVVSNRDSSNTIASGTNTFHAGMVLARDLSGTYANFARPANRGVNGTGGTNSNAQTDNVNSYLGIAADDHMTTGNTFIQNDPVGSTYVDPSSGNLVAANNGWFVGPKRAIGEFQDELVSEVTNLTAGAGGSEGPRRGVGVYTTPSGQFITDQFVAVQTATAGTDSGSPYTFLPGDLLTFGAFANAGKFVALASSSHGPAIARVDSFDGSLLYITQLM